MIRLREGDDESILTIDDFERRARRGEISPFAEVCLPAMTGDRFVQARELSLFTSIYDPRRVLFRRHFHLGRYPLVTGLFVGVWTLANRMLEAAGAPKVGPPISAKGAYALGAVLEVTYSFFGITSEPLMTRFAASELSTAQWFDISAAQRDLGYAPKVTVDEGFRRLAAWCAAVVRC